jgi:hypothetical protein
MVMLFETITFHLFFFLSLVAIQVEQPPLELDLTRRFGTGIGAQIGGTFALRASGPDDLARVEFLLDGTMIGEDIAAPFGLTFVTYDYDPGVHVLSAVGYTAAGETVQSNSISRQFITRQDSSRFTLFILGLVAAFMLARFLFTRPARRGYGYLGGTVCPHCGRPYAMHVWSIRLIGVRLDRCPHCGRWGFVRPASAETLAQAEAFWDEPEEGAVDADAAGDEEAQRRRLEDSRFDGS